MNPAGLLYQSHAAPQHQQQLEQPRNLWQDISSGGQPLPECNDDCDGGTWHNPEEPQKETGGENSGPFSHPVYKQISMRNGEINRMTKEQLKEKLKSLRLDTRGVKEVLKKRLKNYYKRQKLMTAKVKPSGGGAPHYDYLLVIDFEATCQENNPVDFKYEIIEFPIVLIDSRNKQVVEEFHSYVKPVLNPRLTNFCMGLTQITQHQVDHAPTFPTVYHAALQWMEKHQLGTKYKFAIVTDGPWDMARFMHKQCRISGLPFPRWARKWVNVRKAFSNFYGFRRAKLTSMLENMGMCFQGQQHSGLDDSRNIARIVIRMIEDGYDLKVNERIYAHKLTVSDIVADLQVEPVSLEQEEHAAGSSDDERSPGQPPQTYHCDDEKENVTGGLSNDLDLDTCSPLDNADGGGKLWVGRQDSAESEEGGNASATAFQKLCLDDSSRSKDDFQQEGMHDLLAYYALQSS